MACLVLVLAVAAAVAQSLPAFASAAPSPSYRCGWSTRRSTASLLPPDAGVLTGAACGYGDPAELAADGGFHIAAVSTGFFRGGRACGACYQLRCRGRNACAQGSVKVIIADVAKQATDTNRTGGSQFQLTRDAFAALTAPRDNGQLTSVVDTAVDVDFRRIPCAYKSKNLAVRVEENSNRDKGHLAVRFLYQGGQTDIVAVEVAQAAAPDAVQSGAAPSPTKWQYMTRCEGSPGVWRTSRAPTGPLQLRLVVTAGSGGKWLRADGAVLPAEWQPGAVYDTGLQVTDVAAHMQLRLRLRGRRRRGVGAQLTRRNALPSLLDSSYRWSIGPGLHATGRPPGRSMMHNAGTRGNVKRNGERGVTAKRAAKERTIYNDVLGIIQPGPPHPLHFSIVVAEAPLDWKKWCVLHDLWFHRDGRPLTTLASS